MQLGWVDFSKKDREKVHDVMNLLHEQVAVDELGIGLIRDAFANYFFPGTSTVQTRAKYFLIVPYILQEAINSKNSKKYGNTVTSILHQIDEEERDCGMRLYQNCLEQGSSPVRNGIIGARLLPQNWVARKPSSIYWNGLRTWQIFEQGSMSIQDMVRIVLNIRSQEKLQKIGNRKDDAAEGDKDDWDAGRNSTVRFFDIPIPPTDWRNSLDIALTAEEAAFLRNKILKSVPESLLAYLLYNNIEVTKFGSFEGLYEALKDEVPKELSRQMKLACDFNRLVYAARVRYNVLLSRAQNEKAVSAWEEIMEQLLRYVSVDLEAVYLSLDIRNGRLRKFLKKLQEALKSGDISKADELIRKQEIDLKTINRAKLCHTEDYDPHDWVGGTWLDYRFANAKQIIMDIYQGEAADVSH